MQLIELIDNLSSWLALIASISLTVMFFGIWLVLIIELIKLNRDK